MWSQNHFILGATQKERTREGGETWELQFSDLVKDAIFPAFLEVQQQSDERL